MIFQPDDDDTIKSDINIVPLVDIMLVLLIAFMMVSTLVDFSAIDVELPKAATAEEATSLLGTERVVAIHLGAPPPPAPEHGDPPPGLGTLVERPFVVAIGTEERRKGLPLLVEAFAEPAMAHTDAHLVLAGARGDDSDAIDLIVRGAWVVSMDADGTLIEDGAVAVDEGVILAVGHVTLAVVDRNGRVRRVPEAFQFDTD